MTKLPKAALALMIVALVAVVAGVSVVATLAITGPRRAARRADIASQPGGTGDADVAQQTQDGARSTRPRPSRTRVRRPRATTGAARPAPDESTEVTDTVDQVVMEDRPQHLSHFAPAPGGPPPPGGPGGPVRFGFGRRGPSSKHLSNLPAANAVARLSLNDGQRAAVAQFEEAFKQQVDARLLPVQQKIDQATAAFQQAWQSGNQELKNSSREALMNVASEQTDILNELSKEYIDGVKPYLSEEQATQIEKTADQRVTTVVGTVQSGDGPPEVTVNQGGGSITGSITVITSETTDDGAARKTEGDAE